MNLKKIIREIDDYPKKGIVFRDISTILSNPEAFSFTLDELGKFVKKINPDYLAPIESRGFIFASPLSQNFKIPQLLIRKKGKLPPPVISIDYDLEYGKDTLELSSSVIPKSKNILIVDDIIATGGTVNASIDLIRKTGNNVLGILCVIDLKLYKKPFSVSLNSIVNY
ncbi:MAG: adenine phosphoribosyltransferase [Chloroflexi bacterium]|nr:adenine phosphoribosyltransferase [Chloroflexota bacterium]|tara:strand:+ start:2375 stop:2878 length:504 start_codon:yes stop_codon:yes gene_type:complete